MKMNYPLTKKKLFFAATFAFLTLGFTANAQETGPVSNPTDTIYPIVEQAQSDLAVLKRLKITGYVQADYQKADTAGIASFADGNFGSGINNRMLVRRGRVKFAYDNELSQAVLQLDITEKGVGIKDAYLSLTEPWLKTLAVTGGVMDRPFGNEIAYSSSSLESPERSRIIQTLFPGEKDLGGMISLQAPKTSPWNFIRLDAGYFDGNGAAVETDSKKDFIGHLFLGKASSSEKFKWGIGGSYYNGGFAQVTTNYYTMVKDANGVEGYAKSTVTKGAIAKRQYVGVDAQLSLDWALGITQLRAEYLQGTQPGSSSSNASLTAAMVGDTYSRKFNGYYAYFIQNILQTPVQLVVKYDVYDPNTDVSGNNIGKAVVAGNVKTGAADVKYSTLGLGINYRWNSNVKIMAYYDMVTNETTSLITTPSTLTNLAKDRKDNVFTLRLQYKF